MHDRPTLQFERLIEYFNESCFEYLELEHGGRRLCLCRAPAPVAALLRAPSVGTVDFAPGRERLPSAGERIAAGECLFTLRRFKAVIEVCAPTDGSLAAIHFEKGAFVEFGQPLAAIEVG